MREVDFLPGWYPAIHRRHQMLVLQAWATLVLVLSLAAYAGAKRWEVNAARHAASQCEARITLSRLQLARLNQKVRIQDQLKRQDDLTAGLGLNIDATRMLSVLEDAMTPEMALTSLSMETVESVRPLSMAASPGHRASDDIASKIDRLLKVRVDGIAPADIDAAMLMDRLNRMKFLENVTPAYLREGRSRDGHVVREFEVTFEVSLDPSEGK